MCAHLFQLADNLPETLLVQDGVNGAPLLVGQRDNRGTLQSGKHVDDFLQTGLGSIHADIFLVLGILHSLEAEQHLIEGGSLAG